MGDGMMTVGFGLAAVVAVFWVIVALWFVPGLLRIQPIPASERLQNALAAVSDSAGATDLPAVAVVLAARNEASNIRHTLLSLKAQTYADLRVIAVNDRSTDETGSILDEVSQTWPGLEVLHVNHLPPGWLGKNHALWRGAQKVHEPWILFTDADVVFHPTAVQRAMDYLRLHPFDHLVVPPFMVTRGHWMRAFVSLFILCITLFMQPHRSHLASSKSYVGIGAFNLVRTEAYRASGTHTAIAMRPDDDLRLGRLLKEHGFRQAFVPALDFTEVEWYPSIPDMMRGLEKNVLAPFEYSFLRLSGALLALVVTFVGPYGFFIFGLFNHVLIWCCGCIALLALFAVFTANLRYTYQSKWLFVSLPGAVGILVYTFCRSAVLALVRGGVYWRGTFYPLSELRRNAR